MGILAVNIAGFAGPSAATLTPNIPLPASFADKLSFTAVFILFEGKMRALFTLLFGASLTLLIEREEQRGRDGDILQFRRLVWLMLFGLLHYFLFWWGDILFAYALVGVFVLFFRELSNRTLVAAALILFAGWHIGGGLAESSAALTENRVLAGRATAADTAGKAAFDARVLNQARVEIEDARKGFGEQIAIKATQQPFRPLTAALANIGETLPLMLLGMAMLRSGFFTGAWPRRRMMLIVWLGGGLGLTLAATQAAWLWRHDFPLAAVYAAAFYWSAPQHLLIALAYAAALVLGTPRLAGAALGRLVAAAGRMAFSNYIGATLVMTAIFYGWGLGLGGAIGHAQMMAFVGLGWALMLAWSAPWLARFRQGPLESLWRRLVARGRFSDE